MGSGRPHQGKARLISKALLFRHARLSVPPVGRGARASLSWEHAAAQRVDCAGASASFAEPRS